MQRRQSSVICFYGFIPFNGYRTKYVRLFLFVFFYFLFTLANAAADPGRDSTRPDVLLSRISEYVIRISNHGAALPI